MDVYRVQKGTGDLRKSLKVETVGGGKEGQTLGSFINVMILSWAKLFPIIVAIARGLHSSRNFLS